MKRSINFHRIAFALLICIVTLVLAWKFISYETNANAQSNTQVKPVLVLPTGGHTDSVNAIAYSPDGKLLASASADKSIIIWRVDVGIPVKTLTSHTDSVESIDFSPDGKLLVSTSYTAIKLWDITTGKEIKPFGDKRNSNAVTKFSPDGKLLASTISSGAIIWSVETGKEVVALVKPEKNHTSFGDISPKALAFSPSGKVIAVNEGNSVRLWDISTGKLILELKGHSDFVTSLSYSPDEKLLASGSWDNTVKIWDVKTGQLFRTLVGHISFVNSISFSPDGKFLVSGGADKIVTSWNVESGKEIRSLKEQKREITEVRYSPDGIFIASASEDKTINIWNASDGALQKILKSHTSAITSVAFSPFRPNTFDERFLACGSYDKTIKLWDLNKGEIVRTFTGHTNIVTSIAFSPNRKTLASGSLDNSVRLWDVMTGTEVRTFIGHSHLVSSVNFSPDGKTLVSTSEDKTIKLWDIESGQELKTLRGHSSEIRSVTFSSDGKTLASGSADKTIKLWDVESGKELKTLSGHSVSVRSVAFSPDGKILASGSAHQTIKLWDVESGKELRTLTGHSSVIYSISFSPDGKTLASGGWGNIIKLWDVESGKELRTLSGHSSEVRSLAFSSDGKTLASGSIDETTKLWDVGSGKELATLIAVDDSDWLVTRTDTQFDASPSSLKLMYWSLDGELIGLDLIKDRYYEPGLLSKIISGRPLRDVSAFGNIKLYPDVQLQPIVKDSKELTITLKNQGGGIGRVQVFVNGKETIADARPQGFNSNSESATLKVDLSKSAFVEGQQNKISVVAYNAENYLKNLGSELIWIPEGMIKNEPPEFYAIIGGISDYAGDNLDLRFAAKDAEDIAKAFELGAKRLFGADKTHIKLLTNAYATKENFKKAFEDVAKKAKPKDVFVIYLVGHSVSFEENFYYATAEARTLEKSVLYNSDLRIATFISSEEIADWAKQISSLKQVMIFDFGGTSDVVRAAAGLNERLGAFILLGSNASSYSFEATKFGQGILTYALLEGMKGGALRNSFIDLNRLFQYAVDRTPSLAKTIGGIQQPTMFSPLLGTSFDIGKLEEKDRAAISLTAVQPVIIRPSFINGSLAFDKLRITNSIKEKLNSSKSIIFVDIDEMPEAFLPVGTYEVDGSKVKLKLNLVRDNKIVFSINIEGVTTDIERFTTLIAETIIEEANAIGKESSRNDFKMNKVNPAAVSLKKKNATNQTSHHVVSQKVSQQRNSIFANSQTSKKVSFISTDHFNELTSKQFFGQQQNNNQDTFIIVRPVIRNGDNVDLNMRDEVIKVLKDLSGKAGENISYKDVDNDAGAYKFEGVYEQRNEKSFKLRLTIKRGETAIAQSLPSICGSCSKADVSVMFVDMAKETIKNLPIVRGSEAILTAAELKALEYKVTSYALMIATNEYDELRPLYNAICDAEAVRKELLESYGFAEVTTAYNQDVDGMWNAIEGFRKKVIADGDTQLFVFIAGHGVYDAERKIGMLAGKTSKKNDPRGNTYYRFQNLLDDISSLDRFNHIFVVIDACQSGDAIIDSTDRSDPNARSDAEFIIDKLKNKITRKAMTSASYLDVSDGPKGGHSPFAERLLTAFRTYGSNDRFLTIDEIWALGGMDRLKTNPRKGYFKGNVPGSDFLFIAQPKRTEIKCLAECNCR